MSLLDQIWGSQVSSASEVYENTLKLKKLIEQQKINNVIEDTKTKVAKVA